MASGSFEQRPYVNSALRPLTVADFNDQPSLVPNLAAIKSTACRLGQSHTLKIYHREITNSFKTPIVPPSKLPFPAGFGYSTNKVDSILGPVLIPAYFEKVKFTDCYASDVHSIKHQTKQQQRGVPG